MTGASFHWEETEDLVADLLEDGALAADPEGHRLVGDAVVVHLPRVLPPLPPPTVGPLGRPEGPDVAAWLAALPLDLGLQLVVLVQAGATALGLFDQGRELRTKSFKRYVVRGKGRAQPAHLKTRGKSRYGSRLRLQNARAQLEETNERVRDWLAEHGEPERVHLGVPKRLWADLCRTEPVPPFAPDGPLADRVSRIPLDLPVPTTEVLLRTWRALEHGRVEQPG